MCAAILLISCPDQVGITAKVTNFIYTNNGNIEHADQHIDSQSNTFFMRIQWSLAGFKLEKNDIAKNFKCLADEFNMRWSLHFTDQPTRIAIFASESTHCLYDLLLKHKQNYFNCQIPLIISDSGSTSKIAKDFGIKFFKFPKVGKDKQAVEEKEIALLKKEKIEAIVLARYMHILSGKFLEEFSNPVINIHHSFLPAFIGKNPHQQAYGRGVKIIGATSHYVTKKLDAGPIIEQDTIRVSHRDSLADLKRESQELERIVLSRAVRWHLEHKILIYDNKTVVFD